MKVSSIKAFAMFASCLIISSSLFCNINIVISGQGTSQGLTILGTCTITSPGIYRVGQNFAGDIDIAASDVCLNLDCCVVEGTIRASDRQRLSIENGTLTGNSDGIVLDRCENVVIDRLTAQEKLRGIHIRDSSDVYVTRSLVKRGSAEGLFLERTSNVVVTMVQAVDNACGFRLDQSDNVELLFTEALRNSTDGYLINEAERLTCHECRSYENQGSGLCWRIPIAAALANSGKIDNFQARVNSENGISLIAEEAFGLLELLIKNSVFSQNQQAGAHIEQIACTTLSGCDLTSNTTGCNLIMSTSCNIQNTCLFNNLKNTGGIEFGAGINLNSSTYCNISNSQLNLNHSAVEIDANCNNICCGKTNCYNNAAKGINNLGATSFVQENSCMNNVINYVGVPTTQVPGMPLDAGSNFDAA